MFVIAEQLSNNAASTLNGGIDNIVTSLTVANGSVFPATGNFRIIVDSEIMICSARATNVLTVSRGQETTSAASHSNGAAVTHILTKGGLDAYTVIQTLADAKGDLIAGTAADVFGKLTVGANDLFLVADSTQTTGMRWGGTHYATTLPGSPVDGQETILVDSLTVATYQWRFRWNAGSANTDKWEFIGGSPVITEVATAELLNANAVYVALATAGPSFALPRAGVYTVEVGCFPKQAANAHYYMSYDIGGTGAVDADAMEGDWANANNGTAGSYARIKTGLTAVTLTAKYKSLTGNTTFSKRWMRVTPVRVS